MQSNNETLRSIMEDIEKIFHGPDAACCQDVFIPDNRDHLLPDTTPPFKDDREEVTPTKPTGKLRKTKSFMKPFFKKFTNIAIR